MCMQTGHLMTNDTVIANVKTLFWTKVKKKKKGKLHRLLMLSVAHR